MGRQIKLEMVDLLYQSGFGLIFEAIPRPVYKALNGTFIYDYHKTEKKRSEEQQLHDVLTAGNLPKIISGEVVFDNKHYMGLRDPRGNFYRFRKLESLKEWEKESLGLGKRIMPEGSNLKQT